MSSTPLTTTLKHDIAEKTKVLEDKAIALAELELEVETYKREVFKLRRALEILEGTVSEDPPVKVKEVVVEESLPPPPPAPPKPSGPICSACHGRLVEAVARAPSGVLIRLMKCEDCNNEVY